jgi:hypothetical protein
MIQKQRTIRSVPKKVLCLLILSLGLQIIWHYQLPPSSAQIKSLTSPPRVELLRLFSLGDSIVAAKILMLWLQAFETQGGKFLSYQQLNYNTLQEWLARILHLDPKDQYPLLTASYSYSMVNDPFKKRQILEFIYQQFFIDPNTRWQWLAHAAILAKHRLKDLPLALKYAEAIAAHATPNMPYWAQEMRIFILEDMGELEEARLVIGGMLAKGQITDPNEIKFLNEKLLALEHNE